MFTFWAGTAPARGRVRFRPLSSRRARIERTAREVLGFAALRPGQREAVESVLAGRDTLAVLSTGSGKSAIYQIAGLLHEGPTLVVSPLIALQRDQVDGARAERALGAAQLNSSVPEREREEALAELAEDALEFLFLAPEQLANADVARRARRRAGRPSSSSTRRTASPSGATTSGPTTSGSARRSRRSATRACSR